jgi:glycerol-3-phosphate dehydrogenase (NAD(P)+)
MESKPHVAIIGAGELGAAIGGLLQRNGSEPVLWDADPAKVPGQGTLAEAVKDADCVLFCVPSWVMRGAVAAVTATGALREDATVVSFAKGMEDASGKTMTELFNELFPADGKTAFAVVGGPMLAEEIAAGKGAVAVFASKEPRALDRCRSLFAAASVSASVPADGNIQNNIRTEFFDDPFSLSLASVLKNVYAVSLGVADGLGLSGNEKGWIVSIAIQEMTKIAVLLKADPAMVLGATGVGDLIATGYSDYSRNRGIGAEIARTGMCHLQGEGIASLPSLKKRIGVMGVSSTVPPIFPLLDLVNAVGIECKPARAAFDVFFNE